MSRQRLHLCHMLIIGVLIGSIIVAQTFQCDRCSIAAIPEKTKIQRWVWPRHLGKFDRYDDHYRGDKKFSAMTVVAVATIAAVTVVSSLSSKRSRSNSSILVHSVSWPRETLICERFATQATLFQNMTSCVHILICLTCKMLHDELSRN